MKNESRIPTALESYSRRRHRWDFSPPAHQKKKPVTDVEPILNESTKTVSSTPIDVHSKSKMSLRCAPKFRSPQHDSQGSLKRIRTSGSLHENYSLVHSRKNLSTVGGSLGRKCQLFAATNVDNKGVIYLGPTTSSANKIEPRYFPSNPATTLDTPQQASMSCIQSVETPLTNRVTDSPEPDPKSRIQTRQRSQSRPTVDEETSDDKDADLRSPNNEKTSDGKPMNSPKSKSFQEFPVIEVSIPSHKLGSPCFNKSGFAYLQNPSLNNSNTDVSQQIYPEHLNVPDLNPPASKDFVERPHAPFPTVLPLDNAGSPRPNNPPCYLAAPSELYNQLNVKSLCDDPSIVRYSANGRIIAATSARLVVEITSPKVIDYDFLSNFFLTFRSFLATSDLLRMIFSRLKWALLRTDAIGIVVRVRTFVAIRHWILNYFDDDFAIDWNLRSSFCDLLNDLTEQMSLIFALSQVHFKILSELKKCWRKICAVYWETSKDDLDSSVMDPIFPGGCINSQSPYPDSYVSGRYPKRAYKLDRADDDDSLDSEETINNQDPAMDDSRTSVRATFPANSSDSSTQNDLPPSPKSIESEELVTGSPPIKRRAARNFSPSGDQAWATSPKKFYEKNLQVSHQCTTDIWSNKPIQEVENEKKLLIGKFPYNGSLINGDFSSGSKPHENEFFHTSSASSNQKDISTVPKKSFGGVLRVLCSKKSQEMTSASKTQGCISHIPQLCFRGPLPNQLSEKHLHQHARSEVTSQNFPMRFDLLGTEVAKALKQVIKEDKDIEASYCSSYRTKSYQTSNHNPHSREATLSQNGLTPASFLPNEIITRTSRIPKMKAISDGLLPDPHTLSLNQTSNGPTPPDTPPDLILTFPRCSSHLTGIDIRKQSFCTNEAPSLIVDSYPSIADDASLRFSTDDSSDLRSSFGTEIKQRRNDPSQNGITRWTGGCNSLGTNMSSERTEFQRLEHLSSLVSASLLVRPLRRKPGRYLRQAMDHSDEINLHPGSRPVSPKLDQTSSARSSYGLEHDSFEDNDVLNKFLNRSDSLNDAFSLEGRLEPRTRSFSSPMGSRSSMQLPFQKEAQMLALIPDDDDDDGGVESALLKLEGKFPDRSQAKLLGVVQGLSNSEAHESFEVDTLDHQFSIPCREKLQSNRKRAIDIAPLRAPAPLKTYRPKRITVTCNSKVISYQPQGINTAHPRQYSEQYYETVKSTHFSSSHSVHQISNSSFQNLNGRVQTPDSGDEISMISAQKNSDFFHRNLTGESITHNTKHRSRSLLEESFFHPKNEDESEVSSVSDDHLPRTARTSDSPHLTQAAKLKELGFFPNVGYVNEKLTPAVPNHDQSLNKDVHYQLSDQKNPTWSRGATPHMNPLKLNLIPKNHVENLGHLPFILAFDSDTLAQQFTLVEKDVADEIYWKDLVELNWVKNSDGVKSWVEILRSQDPPHGIELVVARFNLVVKWVTSECVLTQNLHERVNCLIKFIHLAANCRKYRNFATSAQITIALTSRVISSMSNTWALVPEVDIQTLKDLNILIASSDEFHNLRSEMEGCGTDQGCIPIIGVYTNDLLVIGEQPSRIPYQSITESLINFDKYQASATVVKNLLRLLDSRQRYRFSPVEGIFERCLWIATLSDAEILRHRNMLKDA
ncbi:hypothetical protein K3495_g1349 [Podosphaera aphanis]|nr:hypothetical protein K3495_g1349 [Podosphaera aphanis]